MKGTEGGLLSVFVQSAFYIEKYHSWHLGDLTINARGTRGAFRHITFDLFPFDLVFCCMYFFFLKTGPFTPQTASLTCCRRCRNIDS
jgi:hypothetical protein